ncbi:LIM domain protein [Aspergillus heteromorphus CBS 117.55]|uniref:LIM domain protein n=1 Tax=Aspergillus heteromorphus CBS 117.55 TaxID=1448321 RepID=A0A317W5M5_9EURO|nr:LIM domain protein [Aspergillus heteromorphus CBS 117.55]PWY80632.1 LIM domain protein [Aspergillus heteromorphus CBS 117.55]
MASMMHRPHFHKPKEGERKASPPGPTYMSNDQIATYLKDLRSNRPARPGGSRPLLAKSTGSSSGAQEDLPPRAASAMSSYGHSEEHSSMPGTEVEHPRATSSLSNHRPASSRGVLGSPVGRPLVHEPRTVPVRQNISPARAFSRAGPTSPGSAYRESHQRRIEKEEARSLRDALQEMDLEGDIELHQAAQDEATELVWMHQNPGLPYKNPYAPYHNPDLSSPEKSPDRSSYYPRGQELGSPTPRRGSRRLAYQGSTVSYSGPKSDYEKSTGYENSQPIFGEELPSPRKDGTLRKNLKVNFALPQEEVSPKHSSNSHGLGLVNTGKDSSKGIFRNPHDRIYEEPRLASRKDEETRPNFSRSDSSALKNTPRNALPRGSRPLPSRFSSLPFVDKLSRFEIHKNPPTQSRNPEYKMNSSHSQPFMGPSVVEEQVPMKDGVEIRGDDIRAATSKRLKDRSTWLPMPTAVSDRAGRPIVSFDPSWRPTEAQSPGKRDSPKGWDATPIAPSPEPSAPTIQISEALSIPVINLPDDKEPTISEMAGPSQSRATNERSSSIPVKSSELPNQSPKKPTAGLKDRWLSTYTRSGVPTAACEACTLPIAGKIVTAAGTRFHPECFVCHHCQTPLECVAFYEEPAAKRNERLAEAHHDDEEAFAPRFYCHLDFHEHFSPRCKSCKTPIEGEVVVACGSEWHVGHFFCAECGDPFNAETPFVEKDGFAWCLQCHSRRTAPRCLGCKKPVLDDVVISAIGGQWHDQCFVCHECGDGFGADGRYFVREGGPRRTAKGRIIGGPVQLAVCERCEGIRLKASP